MAGLIAEEVFGMKRWVRLVFVLISILALSVPSAASAESLSPSESSGELPPRLVLFEGFYVGGCQVSNAAAQAMYGVGVLEFANDPVVLLEYNGNPANANRLSRYTAGFGSGAAPFAMVSSGQSVAPRSSDPTYYYPTYKTMIETELARPAGADIQATWRKTSGRYYLDVTVTNLSEVTLDYATNGAQVQGIAYLNQRLIYTEWSAISVLPANITSLAPAATASYTIDFGPLSSSSYDMTKLHFLAIVDYRPGGATGKYDQLQAARATPQGTFSASATLLTLVTDLEAAAGAAGEINLTSSASTTWTATSNVDWLQVSPATGTGPAQVTVGTVKELMAPGWQEGTISFTASGVTLQVSIEAFLGKMYFIPWVANS
jgi:hypothetical protein